MDARRFSTRSRTALLVSRLPALALLLGLPACYSWRPVDLAPPPRFSERARVQVESSGGQRLLIGQPLVVRDSLVGFAEPTSSRIAVPLTDVNRAWEFRFSGKRTAVLAVGFVAVALAVAAAAGASMDYPISAASKGGCMSIC